MREKGRVVQVGWTAPWHRFKHVAISSARSPTTTCRIFFFFTNIMFPTQSLVESGQQNRWIFRKVPKGGGLSQSKKLCRRFWSFKEGFKLFFFRIKRCKMIFCKWGGGVQRSFVTFPKIYLLWYLHPSLNGSKINHCLALTLAKMFTCQTKQVAEVLTNFSPLVKFWSWS